MIRLNNSPLISPYPLPRLGQGEKVHFVYGLTIFLGAFLLFLIQPLLGKFLLPFFGGGSGVWSVVLVFFLVGLLLGYVYAYLLLRLPKKLQIAIHGLVLTAGLVFSLIFWQAILKKDLALTQSQAPELQILMALLLIIGFPYFFLSSTGPILQSWYAALPKSGEPYRFYALSNLASLLAVAGYPLLIEPYSTLDFQANIWTAFFWLYVIGFAICLGLFSKMGQKRSDENELSKAVGNRKPNYFAWVFLSFIPVLLLLSVTNEITQAIAPVPFLWLAPLGIYLFSFVLAFAWEFDERVIIGLSVLLLISVIVLVWGQFVSLPLFYTAPLYLTALFLTALLCHNTLYALRPHASRLSLFYILVAAGGALGGIFVSFLAPALFKDYWELSLGLFLAAAAGVGILRRFPKPLFSFGRALLLVLMLFVLCAFTVARGQSGILKSARNFYGVLKVRKEHYGKNLYLFSLYNGAILHGSQFIGEGHSQHEPTTYYTATSGVGKEFAAHPDRTRGLRVGVIGLGVGTVAGYCEANDYFRFYEINPAVIQIAQTDFSYLKNCQGRIDIVEGDARIALTKELREGKPQHFDMLVVDAFTDASIPVHLLTQEAFEIYTKHLEPIGGAIAIHISNRYLNLEPVVIAAARHFHLGAETKYSNSFEHDGRPSIWMLLSQTKEIDLDSSETLPLWTDSYSNLFRLLRF